jgi:hypothetical protein
MFKDTYLRKAAKKMSKGKTNKERRLYRRVIKEAKKDGSYPALVNEVLDELVEKGHACPSFHSTAT